MDFGSSAGMYYTLPSPRTATSTCCWKRKWAFLSVALLGCCAALVALLLSWQGHTPTRLQGFPHSAPHWLAGTSLHTLRTSVASSTQPWRRSATTDDPEVEESAVSGLHQNFEAPPPTPSAAEKSNTEQPPKEDVMAQDSEDDLLWRISLWTGVGLAAAGLAALYPLARYLRRARSRKQVPQLIGVAAEWAMANSTGSVCQRTMDKALKIKLDTRLHGTVCETGAGQEVGRIFFYVGGSAETINKALSADDVMYCTASYGDGDRHVTKHRLDQMLAAEYAALELAVRPRRPTACFFSFADTAAAKRYGEDGECHAWMGLKFQPSPGAAPVRVICHARLLDPTLQGQQAALGILGTNLIHCCLYQLDGLQMGFKEAETTYRSFLAGLTDDLDARVEVDVLQCNGPALEAVDERLLGIQLVQQGLTPCVIFTPLGELTVLHDVLSQQPIVTSASGAVEVLRDTAQKVARGEEEALPLPSLSLAGMRTDNQRELGFDDLVTCRNQIVELNNQGAPVLLSNFQNLHQGAASSGHGVGRPGRGGAAGRSEQRVPGPGAAADDPPPGGPGAGIAPSTGDAERWGGGSGGVPLGPRTHPLRMICASESLTPKGNMAAVVT